MSSPRSASNRTSFTAALMLCAALIASALAQAGDQFPKDLKDFAQSHCVECHNEKKAKGDFNIELMLSDGQNFSAQFKQWKVAAERVAAQEMPPDDSKQPTEKERTAFAQWFNTMLAVQPAKPSPVLIRRLSLEEYERTVKTLFGFDLTVTPPNSKASSGETSLIQKLMPADPHGPSGFTNDTSGNPISAKVLDCYSYVADAAITKLFSKEGRPALEAYCGPIPSDKLSPTQAARLLDTFQTRAWRRIASDSDKKAHATLVNQPTMERLIIALKRELKFILISPEFIYRGMLAQQGSGPTGPVDGFELAERLSYFLWADMPDDELLVAAMKGSLSDSKTLEAQINRMIQSPKARSLPEVFGVEWLQLDEIDTVSDQAAYAQALKNQPIEFLNDLIIRNRPLRELLESRTEFVNTYLENYYAADLPEKPQPARRQKGEPVVLPLTKMELRETKERGGLLTMPGILSMNKGPIQRGKWMLERILGERLGEPPPNVPPIMPSKGNAKSFRDQFALHRSNPTCASCHDRIDPVGFAFEEFNDFGGFRLSSNTAAQKVGNGGKKQRNQPTEIKRIEDPKVDASGVLPSGEKFKDFDEFKRLLATTLWHRVVENLVRRTLAYALCRELEVTDEKIVADLTARLSKPEATWGELIHGIVNSIPFSHASFPSKGTLPTQ